MSFHDSDNPNFMQLVDKVCQLCLMSAQIVDDNNLEEQLQEYIGDQAQIPGLAPLQQSIRLLAIAGMTAHVALTGPIDLEPEEGCGGTDCDDDDDGDSEDNWAIGDADPGNFFDN